jgi:hypothetical protein
MRHALVPVLLSVPRLSHCLGLLALKQRKRSLRTDERCDSMSSLLKENRTADPQNFLGLTFLFLSTVCKIYSISRIYPYLFQCFRIRSMVTQPRAVIYTFPPYTIYSLASHLPGLNFLTCIPSPIDGVSNWTETELRYSIPFLVLSIV